MTNHVSKILGINNKKNEGNVADNRFQVSNVFVSGIKVEPLVFGSVPTNEFKESHDIQDPRPVSGILSGR